MRNTCFGGTVYASYRRLAGQQTDKAVIADGVVNRQELLSYSVGVTTRDREAAALSREDVEPERDTRRH